MATERQKKFCIDMYHAAQRINEISPVFVAAQACLESGWGQLESGINNFFGITRGSNWPADKCSLVLTTEYFNRANVRFTPPEKVKSIKRKAVGRYEYKVYRLFKDFDSYEDCLREHLRIFKKPGYADAWPYRKDAREFARRIADNQGCKYATAPDYYKTMSAMIASVEKVIKE